VSEHVEEPNTPHAEARRPSESPTKPDPVNRGDAGKTNGDDKKDGDKKNGGEEPGDKKDKKDEKVDIPAADPNVQLAFRLGWHVAELYHGDLPPPTGGVDEPPATLPGVSDLAAHARAELVLREIRAELHLLAEAAKLAGVRLSSSKEVADALDATSHQAKQVKLKILKLHETLLRDLSAADFRFGKAYGLGRALAETALLPSREKPEAYKTQFAHFRVWTISDWLDDLESAFPSQAAPAVRRGLQAWEEWIKPHTAEDLAGIEGLTRRLRGQTRLWRALLSGEKRPEDLLQPPDYIRAAQNLISETSRLTWSFVRGWWIVILAALLVIWIWAGVIIGFLHGGSKTAAAIVAIIAGLGVSWKAVGATLGKVITRVEQPLWRLELAESIALAATRLPEKPPPIDSDTTDEAAPAGTSGSGTWGADATNAR
jgi:hypothetical protein